MKRYLQFTDCFKVICKKCRSTDVDISVDYCHQCGGNVEGECNKCGNKFSYHDFIMIDDKSLDKRRR